MARPKQVPKIDRQTIEIAYVVEPYFAVSTTDPNLSGTKGVGATKKEALANMRAAVRRRYPQTEYDIIEKRAGSE